MDRIGDRPSERAHRQRAVTHSPATAGKSPNQAQHGSRRRPAAPTVRGQNVTENLSTKCGNGGEAATWFSQIARDSAPGPQGRPNRPPSPISLVVGRRRRPIDGLWIGQTRSGRSPRSRPTRSAPASSGPRPRSSGPASAATASGPAAGNAKPSAVATSTTRRRFRTFFYGAPDRMAGAP